MVEVPLEPTGHHHIKLYNYSWTLYKYYKTTYELSIQSRDQLTTNFFKGALYSPLIWLPMKFNLFYNLQMVLANVLYFFTGYMLTLVHSLVQTQLLNLL